ncbi:ABC transporter ATP-binding protein [Candidatus Poribacteria bacterium]|nr:ABC transporter ATP-binding protein [Candidatus Poribacteria bacterium]
MIAIEFHNVSKRYRLGERRDNLREDMVRVLRKLRPGTQISHKRDFWALRNVSFEVPEGQVLGVVGHNGAGKSTMLKLMSKITAPTKGRITTRGHLASLIELGAGFHPELSGRENIYLNGMILGLKKREVDAKLNSIIEFAELEQFIDTPLKRYSSGMKVRLGFSVAAHLNPDILLIDEVLAVGDYQFRQKCIQWLHQFRESGRTLMVVSHQHEMIRALCSEAIWLERGQMMCYDEVNATLNAYYNANKSGELSGSPTGDVDTPVRVHDVQLLDEKLNECPVFISGEPLQVRMVFEILEQVEDLRLVCRILDQQGMVLHSSLIQLQKSSEQKRRVILRYESLPLTEGNYSFVMLVRRVAVGGPRKRLQTVLEWRRPFVVQNAPGHIAGSLYILTRWFEEEPS